MKKIKIKKLAVYLLVGIIVSTTVAGNYQEARTVEAADPVTLSAAALVAIGLLASYGVVYTGTLTDNGYDWGNSFDSYKRGAENLAVLMENFWNQSVSKYAAQNGYDPNDDNNNDLDNKPPNWDKLVEELHKLKKKFDLIGTGMLVVLDDAMKKMFNFTESLPSSVITDEKFEVPMDLSQYGFPYNDINFSFGHYLYGDKFVYLKNAYSDYYHRMAFTYKNSTYSGFMVNQINCNDILIYYNTTMVSWVIQQFNPDNGNKSNLYQQEIKNNKSAYDSVSTFSQQIYKDLWITSDITFDPNTNIWIENKNTKEIVPLYLNGVFSAANYGYTEESDGNIVNDGITVPDNYEINELLNILNNFGTTIQNQSQIITTFVESMNQAPEPEPEPDPEPEPEPDPEPGTGVDPGTGTDPGGGSGQTPGGADVDNNSFTANLSELFPFCIPFDLVRCFKLFNAEPVTPRVEIPLHFDIVDVDYTFVLDLEEFNGVAELCRTMFLILYMVALILATRGLIRG